MISFVFGESELDLAHISRIISMVVFFSAFSAPPVRVVSEALVLDDVHKAGDYEEEGDDPRHPSERDDGCQESTGVVYAAPAEISPLLSGDGGTNDPQDEEDYEYDQFAAEGRKESTFMTSEDSNEPVIW